MSDFTRAKGNKGLDWARQAQRLSHQGSFVYKLFCNGYKYLIYFTVFLYMGYLSFVIPINFDEAYNLQVPISLIRGHGYNTIYRIRKFDGLTSITTGPTVLLPVSISFFVLGIGKIQARIIQLMFLFSLATIFSYVIKRELRSGIYALILAILFYSTLQLELSFWVLGEIPALFFLVTGIIILNYGRAKYCSLAFGIMGLSVITKFYFIFLIVPILITVFWYSKEIYGKYKTKQLFVAPLFFFLPIITFEVSKLFLLGYQDYLKYLKVFRSFAETQNIALDGTFLSSNYLSFVLGKLRTFSKSLFPATPDQVIWLIFTGVTVNSIIYTLKRRNILVSAFFLVFIIYFLWFIFMDATGWWRRIYPFSILFLYLFLLLIKTLFDLASKKSWKFVLIFLVFVFFVNWIFPSTLAQLNRSLDYPRTSMAQQLFAKKVDSYIKNGYKIGVYGWWQAPEISFLLGGFRFHKFSCDRNYPKNFLVIYTKLQEGLSPQEAATVKQCLDQVIESSFDQQYFLYSVKR